MVDRECCLAFCSYTDGDTCKTSTWQNSIVAGCPFAGFIVPGYSCTDPVGKSTSHVIMNNIAHSNDGSGLVLFVDPAISDLKKCF